MERVRRGACTIACMGLGMVPGTPPHAKTRPDPTIGREPLQRSGPAREDATLTTAGRREARQGRLRKTAFAVALWLLAAGTAGGMETREEELFRALDRFAAGERAAALETLAHVTGGYPDFRAARLIRESLHETGNLRATLTDLVPSAVFTLLEDPTDEAHSRLSYWFERPPRGHLPEVLIEPAPDRRKVVVADTGHSRLYLFDWSDGEWKMQGDWYASIGRGGSAKRREGDMKTPLGVYFVTMWVAGRFLSDLYGTGALGLNYPNDWDRRRQRDGFGIWIHGEPRGVKSRPPRWSQGCLIVSNPAIETLVNAIEERSVPVIIGERLRWLAPDEHERHREVWRDRIASLNGGSEARPGLGIYGYPAGAGNVSTMVLTEFRPEPGHGERWWQYWREHTGGVWRIAHEGPALFDDVHLEGLPPRMPAHGLDLYAP